jgi:hypothetical protein
MSEKVNSHLSNLANFGKLISIIISFGLRYIPTRVVLQLLSLQAVYPKAKVVVENAHETDVAMHKTIAIRKAAYDAISILITKVISALRASDTADEVKLNAAAIVRKIRGTHLKSKTVAAAVSSTTAAVGATAVSKKPGVNTERGFNDQLVNIDKLIKLLSGIPNYTPSEADLTIVALTATYNDLVDKNNAVYNATIANDTAKIARYELCYNPKTGMVDIALAVKDYVKSIYGASSPQYKEVSKLVFKNIPM